MFDNMSYGMQIKHFVGTNDDLDTLVPLRMILTDKDKKTYRQHRPMFTLHEWIEIYPEIDSEKVFYGIPAFNSCHIVYYDAGKYIYLVLDHFILLPEAFEREDLVKAIESQELAFAQKDYTRLFLFTPDIVRFQFLDQLLPTLRGAQAYSLLMGYYEAADFGFEKLSVETVRYCAACKTKKMKNGTLKKLAGFGDTITVYRGSADNSTPLASAYSWATDINMAYRFALMPLTDAVVYQAKVAKAKVVEYLNGHGESEVVILPEDIEVEEEISLPSVVNVWDNDGINASLYQKYRKNLTTIPFQKDDDEHGKLHCLRVLFLSLLIVTHENLSLAVTKALCEAAIYHDSGRVDDEVDVSHGVAGKEIYLNDVASPDPNVSLMIEWHCFSDKDAGKGIENRLSDEYKKAFWILKDADALDRVRFGPLDLDVKQLRYDYSKSLVLVAMQTLKGLKL